jgi:hypothetical protein
MMETDVVRPRSEAKWDRPGTVGARSPTSALRWNIMFFRSSCSKHRLIPESHGFELQRMHRPMIPCPSASRFECLIRVLKTLRVAFSGVNPRAMTCARALKTTRRCFVRYRTEIRAKAQSRIATVACFYRGALPQNGYDESITLGNHENRNA